MVEARRGNDFVEIVYKLGVPPGRIVRKVLRKTNIGPFDFSSAIAILLLVVLNIVQMYGFYALAPFPTEGVGF
jgi:uncharacterized protein YggT (Ycf19 family)